MVLGKHFAWLDPVLEIFILHLGVGSNSQIIEAFNVCDLCVEFVGEKLTCEIFLKRFWSLRKINVSVLL